MHVVNALAGLRPSVENQPIAVSHNLPLVGDAIRDGDQPGHKFMVLGPEVVTVTVGVALVTVWVSVAVAVE